MSLSVFCYENTLTTVTYTQVHRYSVVMCHLNFMIYLLVSK